MSHFTVDFELKAVETQRLRESLTPQPPNNLDTGCARKKAISEMVSTCIAEDN